MDTVLFANAIINGVIVGLLLALPALAITLVFGIARFPNAAAGDYMTFGAYATVAAQAFMGASLVGSAIVATLATGLLSLFFYFWVFRKLAQRSLVARLIASIGIAFAVRAAITFFAGHGQYTIQAPLQRAWNFGGIRILPLDVYILLAALLCPGLHVRPALPVADGLAHAGRIGQPATGGRGRHRRAQGNGDPLGDRRGCSRGWAAYCWASRRRCCRNWAGNCCCPCSPR